MEEIDFFSLFSSILTTFISFLSSIRAVWRRDFFSGMSRLVDIIPSSLQCFWTVAFFSVSVWPTYYKQMTRQLVFFSRSSHKRTLNIFFTLTSFFCPRIDSTIIVATFNRRMCSIKIMTLVNKSRTCLLGVWSGQGAHLLATKSTRLRTMSESWEKFYRYEESFLLLL